MVDLSQAHCPVNVGNVTTIIPFQHYAARRVLRRRQVRCACALPFFAFVDRSMHAFPFVATPKPAYFHLGIVTGCSTRPGTSAGYSRVRVRVGFLQPGPYPYPQPGVGGSAHTFKLRAKSTQTTPEASFGPYVGMFSSFFFVFFSKLTHSL